MEVILKEDVNKLGHRGDVVKVAEGYGRNYLIPHKLAIEATAGNKAVIEQMKAASVRKTAKEKGSAEALGQQLSGQELAPVIDVDGRILADFGPEQLGKFLKQFE